MRPIVGALKFFFRVTVPRPWSTLQALRLPKSNTLPHVLLPERCWELIAATQTLHLQVVFRAMYTCGLRGVDVRHLRPQDVDADRMMLRICTTKGNFQREVPLPQMTLQRLRAYWRTRDQVVQNMRLKIASLARFETKSIWEVKVALVTRCFYLLVVTYSQLAFI
jgi:integrase